MTVNHRIIITLFLAIIWGPLVYQQLGGSSSGQEKRSLAKRPGLDQLRERGPAHYVKQYGKFYNDHFGFRKELIQLNSLTQLSLFNRSTSRRVVTGRDGWLFYGPTIEAIRKRRRFSRSQLRMIAAVLRYRTRILAGQRIPYGFVVVPNKATVYPEYLAPYLSNTPKGTQMRQTVAYLHTLSGIRQIRLLPAFRDAKKRHLLFHRTDTHWNEIGAFVAYREIMNQFVRRATSIKPLPVSAFVPTRASHGGDLIGMLSLKGLRHESTLKLTRRESSCTLKKSLAGSVVVHQFNCRRRGKPRRLLVFGDSFSQFHLCGFLALHFSHTTCVRDGRKVDSFSPEWVKKIKPTLVIQEIVERFLPGIPGSYRKLPRSARVLAPGRRK